MESDFERICALSRYLFRKLSRFHFSFGKIRFSKLFEERVNGQNRWQCMQHVPNFINRYYIFNIFYENFMIKIDIE